MIRLHGRKRAGGFTLVEMMVALVVGLMTMGALIALYLSNSQSVRFQSGVLRVQENGRFAIDMISRSMRMAGYDDPLTKSFEPAAPLIHGTNGPTGALITQTGLKTGTDTVAVRYEGGTNIRDCKGQPVTAGNFVTNLYGISTDNNLVCATRQNSNGVIRDATTLAEGVEDMEVLFGLDTDTDGVANKYVGPAAVGDWTQVVSVQIALLVNSVSNALLDAQTVCLGCNAFNGTSDRMIRAQYETTVGVRNDLQSS